MAPTGSTIGCGLEILEQNAPEVSPKTVRPILFAFACKWKPEFDRREWKTLVSADTVPREKATPTVPMKF
jgi:hypothetical protein